MKFYIINNYNLLSGSGHDVMSMKLCATLQYVDTVIREQ